MKAQCWYKNKETNIMEEAKQEDEGLLLMASSVFKIEEEGTMLIDSGCSNHMSDNRKLFKNIEASQQ